MIEKVGFWLFTATMGIIGYFLKRTMGRVDKNEMDVIEIRESYVKKDSLEKEQEKQNDEIKQIRDNYTTKSQHEKDYDEVRNDIKEMKDSMLRKDDFIREIGGLKAQIEKNQDKTTDLLVKYLGGHSNG